MLEWQPSFEKYGFAIPAEGLTEAEVLKLVEDLSKLSTRQGKAGVRHVLEHPTVSALAQEQRFLGIAQGILGPEALPFRATLFDKSPGRNWLIAWHQDTALPLRERPEMPGWGPWSVKGGIIYAHAPASALCRIIALRIHLDESSFRNGALRVLPATHNLGVLIDDEIHRLSTDIPEVTCAVARGGILAMRPLLIHSSSKSQINAPRRVLHIEYAASPIVDRGMRLAVA